MRMAMCPIEYCKPGIIKAVVILYALSIYIFYITERIGCLQCIFENLDSWLSESDKDLSGHITYQNTPCLH